MSDLAILVAAAAVGFGLSHWLRLPVIPLLIALGFGLSRFGLSAGGQMSENLMALGLAFLVFTAGIELNPSRFMKKLSAVLWIATVQFFVLALAGIGLALLMGFEVLTALYLGGALATSSTFVVVRQLQREVGSLRAFGRLAIGVLLVQDLAVIVLIVILGAFPAGGGRVLEGLVAVVSLGVLSFVGQRWVFPWVVRRTRLDDEYTLLVFLAALFVFAGLADAMGLPFVVGAFFAGFSLSSFPVNGVARSLLSSLSSFFLAIFFTALGALAVLPGAELSFKALGFVVLVLVLTPPLVAALAEWKGGVSSRNGIKTGLLLAQTSEFSIVLGLLAVAVEGVPAEVMAVITIVAVTTMTITPLLATDRIARRLLALHPLRRRLSTETDLRDHILLLGMGSEGKWAIKPLREAGHHVVVVDHDPAMIEHLESTGIPCIRGDTTDDRVLSRAGFEHAKAVLVAMPNVHEALRVLRYNRPDELPVIVRVFEEEHAQEIGDHGGIPVLNSHASADAFMGWFAGAELGGGRKP